MLPLESPRWESLDAGAASARLARELLVAISNGDEGAFDELGHQICHQMTVNEVAYAVVPHLVAIAQRDRASASHRALALIGYVVASRRTHGTTAPPIPAELEESYLDALTEARSLCALALSRPVEDRSARWALLHTLAALQEESDLAMHMFLSGPNLSCPECGERISFSDRA